MDKLRVSCVTNSQGKKSKSGWLIPLHSITHPQEQREDPRALVTKPKLQAKEEQ